MRGYINHRCSRTYFGHVSRPEKLIFINVNQSIKKGEEIGV